MDEKRIPILSTLSLVYLLIPILLYAFGWLREPFAWITTVLVVVVMTFAGRDLLAAWKDRRERSGKEWYSSFKPILPAGVVVLAWVFLSGTGGFGLQNGDYHASNALFKALIDTPWPLQAVVDHQMYKIVYYVAYYLPAAAVGKLLGWGAANVFIFLWTVIGIFLSFSWFWKVSAVKKDWKQLLALAVLFCLASGMDWYGYYILHHNPFELGKHIERWTTFYLQYTSQTALLFWVPQHTIAAWLITGLTIDSLHCPQQFKYLGMAIAASMLWSPFGVVGVALYLLIVGMILLVRKAWQALFNPQSLVFNLFSIWLAFVNMLYLSSNEYEFPNDWMWNVIDDKAELIGEWLAFWLLEFGLLVMVVLVLMLVLKKTGKFVQPQAGSGAPLYLFFAAIVILIVLPTYKMGYNNDFVMRVSIPSTFIMWAVVGRLVLSVEFNAWPKAALVLWAVILVIVMSGWVTSLSEIGRSVARYHFGPPDISKVVTIETANKPHTVQQRLGTEDTFFYQNIGK
ncbi:MAG: hypothetical protein JXA13_04170 [Anaerolineales bacterium]|nr:hypothetical protein [Anaerolineales bacterium]